MATSDKIADLERALRAAKQSGSAEERRAAMTALREARRTSRIRKARQARAARRSRGVVSCLTFTATPIGVSVLLAYSPAWVAPLVFLVAVFALAIP